MLINRHPALMVLALCALLVPAIARPPDKAPNRAGQFPDFLPFVFNQAEFPEGLAVDKVGNVYVSIRNSLFGPLSALSNQLWKVSSSGEKSVLADFGTPGGGAAGLAVDAQGNVYMVLSRISAYPGVYRVDTDGNVALVPGTDQIVFPNALAFDQQGTLYITETASGDDLFGQGGIWRVKKRGTAQLWIRDELLTGLGLMFSFPVGANGIAWFHGSLYVVNTDRAVIVRVPVRPDGSPGQPEVWQQIEDVPESPFYQFSDFPLQIDGVAIDVLGNAYVTVTSRNAIVRINADDRSQETVAVYPHVPLDAPVNLAFGTGRGERQHLFITNMGVCGLIAPGTWPGPGLVKVEVGIPGVPLP